MQVENHEVVWYPLRVTYARELKVKEYLDEKKIECFIPMHYQEKLQGEIKVKQLVPVIHNLLFVRTDKKQIDILKADSPVSTLIRYLMNPVTHLPVIIPEKQMQDFIAVAGTTEEQVLYLSTSEVSMKKGDRVRITGGIWEGVEGRFIRVKRGMRVVVEIEGIMAVATASLHPSLVQRLNPNSSYLSE